MRMSFPTPTIGIGMKYEVIMLKVSEALYVQYVRMYVCMYVWSSHIARVRINRIRLPILHVVS